MSTIQASERTAIQEELARLLRAEADEDTLRSGMQSDRGYDHAIWQKMAEMGLLGIAISEDFGGIGGSAIDTAMVAEELGRSLLPVPFIETCVIAPALLESSDMTDEIRTILTRIAHGTATHCHGRQCGHCSLSRSRLSSRDKVRWDDVGRGIARDAWRLRRLFVAGVLFR